MTGYFKGLPDGSYEWADPLADIRLAQAREDIALQEKTSYLAEMWAEADAMEPLESLAPALPESSEGPQLQASQTERPQGRTTQE